MDPFTWLTVAIAFVGAEVAKKVGGAVADQAYQGLKSFLKTQLGREIQPEDLTPDTLRAAHADASAAFVQHARSVVARSTALRRAQMVRPVLDGARALWVDDHPGNNVYECRTLSALGVTVELARSTADALAKAGPGAYHVILSDMARDRSDAGLVMLRKLREMGCRTQVIFYVGQVDEGRGIPAGAFGLTKWPESLLHYVLDVLERERV